MPTFISHKGKWYPTKERIALKNKSDRDIIYNNENVAPGQDFIYEGPDREALKAIHENGGDSLGADFVNDPEFRQSVRNQGFESVEAYLENIGYDEEKVKKDFEEKASVVRSHEIPKRVKEILVMGGGQDTSGEKNNDTVGGFGDERIRKPAELRERKNGG